MKLGKILDSNILIYSLLRDHPASTVCEKLILSSEDKFEWITSPITFFEAFHVLVRIYGQIASQVIRKLKQSLELPLRIISLDDNLAVSALENIIKYEIDMNDSVLMQIGINKGISIIATDDKKLIKVSGEFGLICENPITREIRKEMTDWEEKNLPEKGLTRIYSNVYQWLHFKNQKLAEAFKSETKKFTHQI